MKNKQKGFIVPLIIAIIAALAIGGGVYAYHQKKVEEAATASTTMEIDSNATASSTDASNTGQQTIKSNNVVNASTSVNVNTNVALKTFTSTNGLYSLSYPATWTHVQTSLGDEFKMSSAGVENGIVVIPQYNNNDFLTAQFDAAGIKYTSRSGGSIDGYPVTIIDISSSSYSTDRTYMVSLGKDTKGNDVVIDINEYIRSSEPTGFQNQITAVINSLRIVDLTKINSLFPAPAANSQVNISSLLKDVRNQAEVYYDRTNSYAGVCLSQEFSSTETSLNTAIGAKNVSCKDTSQTYSLNAYANGQSTCVDSTGFVGQSSSINTNGLCSQ